MNPARQSNRRIRHVGPGKRVESNHSATTRPIARGSGVFKCIEPAARQRHGREASLAAKSRRRIVREEDSMLARYLRTYFRSEQGPDLIEFALLLAFFLMTSSALFMNGGKSTLRVQQSADQRLEAASESGQLAMDRDSTDLNGAESVPAGAAGKPIR